MWIETLMINDYSWLFLLGSFFILIGCLLSYLFDFSYLPENINGLIPKPKADLKAESLHDELDFWIDMEYPEGIQINIDKCLEYHLDQENIEN